MNFIDKMIDFFSDKEERIRHDEFMNKTQKAYLTDCVSTSAAREYHLDQSWRIYQLEKAVKELQK